jgi:phosphotriesterase-related protein
MVTTVTGVVSASELGVTLAHEHLFIDLRNQFTPFEDAEKQAISEQPVQMSNLGRLRRSPYAVRDNLVLDDLELAVAEAREFQKLGGRTVVDCTSIGIRREPLKLRELAQRTGLNIIAGCGYYTHDTHPPEMNDWSAEQIAEMMVRDLTEGMKGTDVKAGIIGEIGTSDPIHPNEKKNLIASALAYQSTPAAVFVHTYPWGKAGLEATDVLVEHGVDPAKIVICHIDVEFDVEYIKALLQKRVFVEFDNFGKEFYIDPADRGFAGGVFARDIERVRVIKALTDSGYERQILVTNDICLKSMLRHYGGWGYDHILRNIVPMMQDEGISQQAIDAFLIDNPQRLLAIDSLRVLHADNQ